MGSSQGLPLGMQIIGRQYQDASIFQLSSIIFIIIFQAWQDPCLLDSMLVTTAVSECKYLWQLLVACKFGCRHCVSWKYALSWEVVNFSSV